MENNFDVICVGAGSGGLNIAGFMNKAGFNVLLVDKTDRSIGGDCLNFGCVPSKALIHAAKKVQHAREAKEFGMKASGDADIKKVMSYVKGKVEHIREHENADWFRKQGMTVELGEAEFNGENSILVNGKTFTANKIIIATGSRPRIPKIKGIEKVKEVYTNETIFEIKKLPKRLLVIGAGPIGCELGQAFSRLGSKVTMVQRRSQFLEKEDEEVAKILQEHLEKEGINIQLNCEPKEFVGKNKLKVNKKEKEEDIGFDAVLIAAGRELNIPKGLDKANVEILENGKIKVDEYLKTTNKNIILCGDIAGGAQFTHAAELHTGTILNNFFSPLKKKLSYDNFSWVTYTDPEIATFGLNEKSLKERGIEYTKIVEDYSHVDRGITDSAKGKLILYISKKRIVGGSLIAPGAGEIFQELALAMSSKLDIKSMFEKIYPYPTASRVNKKAITQLFAGKLTPKAKKFLSLMYKLA